MDKNQSAEPAARRGWGQTQSLLTVVFVCGAVLMAFEMVGFRILAPTFGTTTFAVGSVISVFLGALSLGYLLGGRLSDKHPSFFLLGTIIAVSGVIVLVVPLYAPAGCLWISSMNPEGKANPLFASILLFLAPSVLLGMVSPFAVRLQAKSVSTVGNVAGKLYALSTLGSIAGTLLATFWLIPSFGGSAIAASLGLVLIAVSLLALLPGARDRLGHGKAGAAIATTLLVALGMGLWFIPHPSFIPLREGEILVEEVDSPYQHIGVVLIPKNRRDDGTQKKEEVKWAVRLQFDQYIESEVDVESGDPENVRVSEPYTSNAKYTDMLHLPLLF
ncbi:fused MFS/spermidine synthase, partial [bacterium]|nr:fused MFS/spermidine synthase [bacterium]